MSFTAFTGDTQENVIKDVILERRRQMAKHPTEVPGSGLDVKLWLTFLMEEVGEVARAIIEDKPAEYRTELVQVAALAVAAMEDYDVSVRELCE